MTRVALVLKQDEMVKEDPSFAKQKFLYSLKRADYEREWGTNYQKPGFGARFMAVLFRLVPKIGPFRALAFKMPSPETETLYLESVNASVTQYQAYLHALSAGKLKLEDKDFDTGKVTRAGEYRLTDEAYAQLLNQLADAKFADVSPELRQNILDFYADPGAITATKRNPDDWNKTLKNIEQLRAQVATATAPAR
jgi:hypothetical protein